MQILSYNSNTYSPNFQRFIKVEASPHDISNIKNRLRHYSGDINMLTVEKKSKESMLYFFTGKTYDKFIDLLTKVDFYSLKNNIEQYMKLTPEKMKLKTLENLLHNKKL